MYLTVSSTFSRDESTEITIIARLTEREKWCLWIQDTFDTACQCGVNGRFSKGDTFLPVSIFSRRKIMPDLPVDT